MNPRAPLAVQQSDGVVPPAPSRFWPFVLGTADAYQPPPWNARLLLWWGLVQALFHIQPTQPRENWRKLPREFLATLMHKDGAGHEHPSRAFVTSLIRAEDSVLDVGCGAVVLRHVLEHLPDFEVALREAISVSHRLAVFVF